MQCHYLKLLGKERVRDVHSKRECARTWTVKEDVFKKRAIRKDGVVC